MFAKTKDTELHFFDTLTLTCYTIIVVILEQVIWIVERDLHCSLSDSAHRHPSVLISSNMHETTDELFSVILLISTVLPSSSSICHTTFVRDASDASILCGKVSRYNPMSSFAAALLTYSCCFCVYHCIPAAVRNNSLLTSVKCPHLDAKLSSSRSACGNLSNSSFDAFRLPSTSQRLLFFGLQVSDYTAHALCSPVPRLHVTSWRLSSPQLPSAVAGTAHELWRSPTLFFSRWVYDHDSEVMGLCTLLPLFCRATTLRLHRSLSVRHSSMMLSRSLRNWSMCSRSWYKIDLSSPLEFVSSSSFSDSMYFSGYALFSFWWVCRD